MLALSIVSSFDRSYRAVRLENEIHFGMQWCALPFCFRKEMKRVLCLLSVAFGINSILYQRGIYPAETFTRVTQYDMSLQLTTDAKLKNYLTNVISQLKGCFSIKVPHLVEQLIVSLTLVMQCHSSNT